MARKSDGQPERVFVEGTFPSNYVERVPLSDSINLRHLLELKGGRFMLMEFLKSEYSQENLEFWARVENYRSKSRLSSEVKAGVDLPEYVLRSIGRVPSAEEIQAEAEDIYDAFISADAVSMININSDNRRLLESARTRLKSNPSLILPGMFDSAQLEILRLLNLDSFGRFKKSPYWQKLLVHFGITDSLSSSSSTA
jgi:hypothetical protein